MMKLTEGSWYLFSPTPFNRANKFKFKFQYKPDGDYMFYGSNETTLLTFKKDYIKSICIKEMVAK